MRFVLSLLFLVSSLASGATSEVKKVTVLNAASAIADQTSSTVETSRASMGSFHCTWASLGGTPDGVFQVQVSNNDGTSWVTKTGASITVSGASGGDVISLNGVVTESLYRIIWTKNSVATTGTVTCIATFKG